jgi:ABC-type dipeptide/oligopeptide/nickel transport system ATPase component
VLDDIKGIPGRPPTAGQYPAGCRFAARCEFTTEPACTAAPIDLEGLGDARQTRCVRVQDLSLPGVLS